MTVTRMVTLRAGERADLVQESVAANEVHCLSGCIHIVMRGVGLGIAIRAGEKFLLRSRMSYHMTARKKTQLAIHCR